MFAVKEKVELHAIDDLCVRCGDCEEVCPSGVFSWDGDEIDVHHPGRCIGCGHCVAACPEAALRHSGLPFEQFTELPEDQTISPDTLNQLFQTRRSSRRLSPEPLTDEELERLLDAARYAPTSTNSQNVRFIVFAGKEQVRRLAEWTSGYYLKLERQLANPFVRFGIGITVGFKVVNAYRFRMPAIAEMFRQTLAGDDRLFYDAPAVIVAYASGLPHLASASCNLAAMQLLLAADAQGLGACFNGYALTALVRERKVREQVGITKGYTPGAVLTVGRPVGRFHRVPPRNKRRVIWFDEE